MNRLKLFPDGMTTWRYIMPARSGSTKARRPIAFRMPSSLSAVMAMGRSFLARAAGAAGTRDGSVEQQLHGVALDVVGFAGVGLGVGPDFQADLRDVDQAVFHGGQVEAVEDAAAEPVGQVADPE